MNNFLKGQSGATFSQCGQYRYALWRRWDEGKSTVMFIMLNPSKADAECNDATIRRCLGFADSWGFGSLLVGNLFAWKATKPADLKAAERAGKEIVGPCNDDALEVMVKRAQKVIAAWGNHGVLQNRSHELREKLRGQLYYLKLNKTCEPAHPLTLPKNLKPCPLGEC